jgi:hypothetical protein
MAGSPNSGHIDLRERGTDERLAAKMRENFADIVFTGIKKESA